MKKNATRRALLSSLLSLLLCCSMLLGTTFAWFTDSVTSSGNIIKSGTLDVEMSWAYGKEDPAAATWTDASTGAIFNNDLWEPGYTEVRHIKITNEGTLALKYQLAISPTGTVSKLSDVIDVYFGDPAAQVAQRTDLTNLTKVGTLTEVLKGMPANTAGELTAGADAEVTIALKMQETAGNEYQDLAIGTDFAVQLLATQLTAEADSFDNTYDEDAWHPDMTVCTVEELSKALASGGKIQVTGTLNAGATQDVPNWTNAPAEFIFDATTLDALKGGDYILDEGSKYGVVALISAGESLALSDMKITANSQWPVYLSNYGGNLVVSNVTIEAEAGAGIYPYGTNGTTVLNNVKVNQNYLDPAYSATTPWAATAVATSNGHNLVINGGTYIGSQWAVYGYNSGSTITINGGTFKAPKVIQLDGVWSGSNKSVATINGGNFDGSIYLDWGTNVPELYINGGNFTNFSATVCGAAKLVIKGGTFDADPSAFVAKGYKATQNADSTWTVGAYKISTGAELVDAIANGKAVELTQDVSLGKIDLTGAIANDVVIDANGHKITTADSYGVEVTAGKNVTISNADVEMTKAGDYITYAAGFKIANGDYAGSTITLKNCTITMANADWAYAVNMPASVKNLNLVIDNCTLEGAIAVQCWGDNNTITITNSKLICNYTTNALYTSYCVVLQDDGSNAAENNTLVIDNCEFQYSGIDNFNSSIYAVADVGSENNTITVTNCTYGEKVVAD